VPAGSGNLPAVRISAGVVVAVAAVVAVGGCGSDQPGGPAVRSEVQTQADVQRYADQTAKIIESDLTNALVTTTACSDGLYRVQGVYRVPLWIRWQPRRRATLRTTWQQNQMPITVDKSPDGWLGAIGTVTPDGYAIDVASSDDPVPLALTLQVRSPCVRAPKA
jgi:hypothetical protein